MEETYEVKESQEKAIRHYDKIPPFYEFIFIWYYENAGYYALGQIKLEKENHIELIPVAC